MEHDEVSALMERWAAKAAAERSGRKLVLHTEAAGTPAADLATRNINPLRVTRRRRMARWSIAASIAAAMMVGITVFVTPETGASAPVVCMVNGKRVTDPARIEQYTLEALQLVEENLRRPGVILSSNLGEDPAMTRVGEMLNELTNNQ